MALLLDCFAQSAKVVATALEPCLGSPSFGNPAAKKEEKKIVEFKGLFFRNLFNVLSGKQIWCERYSKSLTVGVKKKKTIPLCDVTHDLTSRTYGEKK